MSPKLSEIFNNSRLSILKLKSATENKQNVAITFSLSRYTLISRQKAYCFILEQFEQAHCVRN